MNYDTHAEWCEFLEGIGQLDDDHRFCTRTAYCVASSRRAADTEAARRQVEGHRPNNKVPW